MQDYVQKIFSVVDLSIRGYLLLADRDDTYIYWPNPEQGLAHRQQTHLQEKTYTERRTEHTHGVLKQLVDHCFKTEKRPAFPAHLSPPSWPNVWLLTYQQLEDAIAGTASLSVSRLKRGGYILDAQRSKARKGIGYFILCLDGPEQSAAIKASPWYEETLAAQRRHGYDNVNHRPAVAP